MNKAKIIVGDNRTTLKTLADKSVQCVVTSPPYWGLRDYGTATWIGGDENCTHRRESKKSDATITGHKNFTEMLGVGDAIYKDECPRCGAVREDEQIGLETEPEAYIEELCQVFDEVWRVLKDNGTLWVNLGDSYSGSGKGTAGNLGATNNERNMEGKHSGIIPNGLKRKELVGIPWRFAFAMQARGWYLRQDIIWAKPNPMPESVTDRCTKSHEYIFLLSKSPKYFFDSEAIKEEATTVGKPRQFGASNQVGTMRNDEGRIYEDDGKRNKRDVWNVGVKPYAEAHFATYPPELILPCILAGSAQGDIILDPFSGSGTTGEVALENNRNYIGLELNPEYAQLSLNRLFKAGGIFGEVEIVE